MINKLVASADAAVADIEDGAVIYIGGFAGPGGIPAVLISALARKGAKNLTIITCDAGRGTPFFENLRQQYRDGGSGPPGIPIPDRFVPAGLLVEQGQVKKAITSFASEMRRGSDGPLEARVARGEVEIEIVGQGTIAERARAARAGIPAFYTPVGVGTFTAEGKEVRDFDGVPHVLEHALRADFSLIAAHQADRFGNLVYDGTSRNINPVMAGAADVTIVEVDEVVPLGALNPEHVTTPGIYVDRVIPREAPSPEMNHHAPEVA